MNWALLLEERPPLAHILFSQKEKVELAATFLEEEKRGIVLREPFLIS